MIKKFDDNKEIFLPFKRERPAFVGGLFTTGAIIDSVLKVQIVNQCSKASEYVLFCDMAAYNFLFELELYNKRTQIIENSYI